MTIREHVEEVYVNRLTRMLPDEVEVSQHELERMLAQLDLVYYRILNKWYLPGFTDDDLISLMHLKTYQMLRRGKYDYDRKAHSLFYQAFDNMMKDMSRSIERAKIKGFEFDPLDTLRGVSEVIESMHGDSELGDLYSYRIYTEERIEFEAYN
jgi:hypothetical protein